MTLRENILGFVKRHRRPVSIERLACVFPKINRRELLIEVWSLSGDGLLEFDWDWKIKVGPGWVPIDH